jgi:hypothetical protein
MVSPLDHTPQSKRELLELQTVLYFDAPDKFSVFPNLRREEQRNLPGTIGDLHRGIDQVYRKARHDEVRVNMHELVDRMYEEFEAGKISEGRETSLNFRDLVMQTRP